MITPATRPRQYHIDWLRVIAIFLVFVYHTLRPFSSEGFHVVNDRAYAGVDIITTILPIFGMPLVFLISGAGAFYALGKRSGGRYLWDRVLRLLVQRPGRVFTRDELLAKVWDDTSDSFDRTVDAHIKTLRAKLKAVAPAIEPIRTLRGTGYALSEDLPESV